METLGFIGLGTMGGPMATNLLKAGHPMVVMDINPAAAEKLVAAGARRVDTPDKLAEAADIVLMSLPGPEVVRPVVLSLLPFLRPGHLVIDLSTCTPLLAHELAPLIAERGAQFVDATVTGAVIGAQRGTLKIMVGAQGELFERVRALLQPVGDEFLSCGPVGTGYALKVIRNSFTVARTTALLEEMELAEAAGVDPRLLIAVQRMKGQLPMPLPRADHPDLSTTYHPGMGQHDPAKPMDMELAEQLGKSWKIGRAVHEFWAERERQEPGQTYKTRERLHRLLEGWVDD